jgi:hypothetical protein
MCPSPWVRLRPAENVDRDDRVRVDEAVAEHRPFALADVAAKRGITAEELKTAGAMAAIGGRSRVEAAKTLTL